MSGIAGALAQVTGTVAQVSALANGVSGLAGAINGIATGTYAAVLSGLGAWANGMQIASWRGLPFAVRESTIHKGRRTAKHVYPYRDSIWVEDLGRGVRRYAFRGFLVGDDVLQQSEAMQTAIEAPGPGTLVHPALGPLTCAVGHDIAFRQTERGRVIEVEFEFIETASSLFPSLVQSTQAAVQTSATGAFAAIASDFQNDVAAPLAEGSQVVTSAAETVAGWAATATRVMGDASLIAHAVSGLSGNWGRYNSASMTLLQPATASIASLLAGVTTARTAVTAAADAAQTLAGAL